MKVLLLNGSPRGEGSGTLKLARAFARQDRFALQAEEYKRPKGSPQPPLDQWYNRKNLDITCARPVEPLLYSPELVDVLVEGYESLMPYYRYFSKIFRQGD